MMMACVCGGYLEITLVALGFGWLIALLKKLKKMHNKNKCSCCQKKQEETK
jgi:hypothetical protein